MRILAIVAAAAYDVDVPTSASSGCVLATRVEFRMGSATWLIDSLSVSGAPARVSSYRAIHL
jgi:hypothetical protein